LKDFSVFRTDTAESSLSAFEAGLRLAETNITFPIMSPYLPSGRGFGGGGAVRRALFPERRSR
jgi:hypothetical protein